MFSYAPLHLRQKLKLDETSKKEVSLWLLNQSPTNSQLEHLSRVLMMIIRKVIIIALGLLLLVNSVQSFLHDYWKMRTLFLRLEETESFGGDIVLDPDEQLANNYLMLAKNSEIKKGLSILYSYTCATCRLSVEFVKRYTFKLSNNRALFLQYINNAKLITNE